jgi:hypothetical protein
MERFDRFGYHLQAKHRIHVTDIVKYGCGGILLAMTIVISTARGLTSFGQLSLFVPYAMLWGFYAVIAVPWLVREKRRWSVDRMAHWFAFADGLRRKLFPFRVVICLMVMIFSLVPSAGDYFLGNPETWVDFGLTVFRSLVVPGFILPGIYLLCLYPVPPSTKAQEKKESVIEAPSLQPAP